MPRLRAIGRTTKLRQLLYAYAAEVLAVLRENGEWPVPFGTMIDLSASHAILSSSRDLRTSSTLSAYLRSGQIGQALEATGHRWIWHREVIGDLFVERVLARTFADHEQLDLSVLDRVSVDYALNSEDQLSSSGMSLWLMDFRCYPKR